MSGVMIQAAGIFGAGVLTSLTPCVYPMIPITVGYLGASADGQTNHRAKIVAFFLGQVLVFTVLGVVAASLGEILGFSSEMPSVQLVTGAVLMLMGALSLRGRLPDSFSRWNQRGFFQTTVSHDRGVLVASSQALLMGGLSALVASPCTSPVLGGVLASIAQADSILVGTFLMSLYGAGMSSIFLVLGLGLISAKKLPKSGVWLSRFHAFSGVLLLLGGLYYVVASVKNW